MDTNWEVVLSNKKEIIAPGIYCAFVLCDDGTWSQPSFEVAAPAPRGELLSAICRARGGFVALELVPDEEGAPSFRIG